MPYFFSIRGEMRVILCLKKASQIWELPEKNPGRRENRLMLVSMTVDNVISYNICRKHSIRLVLPWASRSNLFPCSGGTQYLHIKQEDFLVNSELKIHLWVFYMVCCCFINMWGGGVSFLLSNTPLFFKLSIPCSSDTTVSLIQRKNPAFYVS